MRVFQVNIPIAFTVRGTNGTAPNVNTTLRSGRYYYYRVYMGAILLYTGKTYCISKNGEPVIEMKLDSILKDYAFNGYKSIKPVLQDQDWKPQINTDGETLTTLDNDFTTQGNMTDESEFGNRTFTVEISEYPAFNISYNVYFGNQFTWFPYVTCSWNIDTDPDKDNSFQGFKSVLKYETDFISHYPMIVTDNYGIMYMVNVNSDYMGNQYADMRHQCIYIANKPNFTAGQTQEEDEYTGIRYYTTGGGGYLCFNAPMSAVINSLDPGAYVPDYITNVINGGDSTTTTSNSVIGGNSETVISNSVIGGDSTTSMTPVYGYDNRYKVYLWKRTTFENNETEGEILVGVIDECPADYYLTWLSRSGCPVSYGFSGNSKIKNNVSNTYTLSADNFKSAKIQDFTRSWNLKSGKVDKITYDMFADILTSPYVCLWEKDKDHLHYVTVDTSNWEEKKVKETKQPLNFEISLTEAQQYKLMH